MQYSENSTDNTPNITQFSKFLVVGFSNFAVSFAVFYLLYNHWKPSGFFYSLFGQTGLNIENFIIQLGATSLDATLANILGYSAGIINSFVWNKLWTFKVQHETMLQFGRFLVLNVCCLIISSASLFLFTDYLGWNYMPVWLVTMGIVTFINFVVSKYWVFVNK